MGLLTLAGALSGAGQGLGQALQTVTAGYTQKMLMDERAKLDDLRDLKLKNFEREKIDNERDYTATRERELYDLKKTREAEERTRQRSPEEIQSQVDAKDLAFTAETDLRKKQAAEEMTVAEQKARAAAHVNADLERDRQKASLETPAREAVRAHAADTLAPERPGELTARSLDNKLKQIQLDNAARLKELRVDYQKASPEKRSLIEKEVALLTGKDNDNFIAVATGFDEVTGKPTAYKVFNKKSGEWVEPKDGTPKTSTGGPVEPTDTDRTAYLAAPDRAKADQAWQKAFGAVPPPARSKSPVAPSSILEQAAQRTRRNGTIEVPPLTLAEERKYFPGGTPDVSRR